MAFLEFSLLRIPTALFVLCSLCMDLIWRNRLITFCVVSAASRILFLSLRPHFAAVYSPCFSQESIYAGGLFSSIFWGMLITSHLIQRLAEILGWKGGIKIIFTQSFEGFPCLAAACTDAQLKAYGQSDPVLLYFFFSFQSFRISSFLMFGNFTIRGLDMFSVSSNSFEFNVLFYFENMCFYQFLTILPSFTYFAIISSFSSSRTYRNLSCW